MLEHIRLEQAVWGSEMYEQGLKLRDSVLRQPLGLSIYDDPLDLEQQDIHLFAVFAKNEAIVGTLLLRKVDEETLQMKQVAVDEGLRGTGVGRKLVAYGENLACHTGYSHIILHARQTAIPFYEKLQYVRVGDLYSEVGILHQTMVKKLQPM